MLKMANLKRDKKSVMNNLIVKPDGSVYTKKDCSILIPKSWTATDLADLNTYSTLAVFAIMMGDKYLVFSNTSIINIGETEYREVDVDGTPCIEFMYESGSKVIDNMTIAVNGTLVRSITYNLVKRGRVAPYLSVDDFYTVLDSIGKINDLRPISYCYLNIYLSYVCRDPKDKLKQFRLSSKNGYVNIPLSSVVLSASTTMAKLNGSRLDEGIQSAILNQSETSTKLDEILLT